MSVNRGRTFTAGRVRPAQVFKKRNNVWNTAVATGSNATLLSEIVLRETGTIYSVKLSFGGLHQSAVAGDAQVIRVWVRCVPASTGLPNLNTAVELDTMNGFFVGTFIFIGTENRARWFNEKFRFRRKCDENSLIQVLAESSSFNGTGRVVELTGTTAVVIRVK